MSNKERPEGAKAPSPGQRPGVSYNQKLRPERAKALIDLRYVQEAFAPSGRALSKDAILEATVC